MLNKQTSYWNKWSVDTLQNPDHLKSMGCAWNSIANKHELIVTNNTADQTIKTEGSVYNEDNSEEDDEEGEEEDDEEGEGEEEGEEES